MSVESALGKRLPELRGKSITPEETEEVKRRILAPQVPSWLLDLLREYPLAGTAFRLSEDQDQSGLGVAMRWLTPPQMISETVETYPAIAAAASGYLPIGMCLKGSGDYYFLKTDSGDDPPVVRIPHDAVDGEYKLLEDQVEVVAQNLSTFFEETSID
jgi:hypothetical protein